MLYRLSVTSVFKVFQVFLGSVSCMHHLWPLWDLNDGLLLTVFLEVFSVLFSEIHAFVVLHWAQDFVNNFVGSLFWSLGFFWYFCFPQALLFWPLGLKNLGLNLALYLLSSNALMSGTKGLNYRKRGKQSFALTFLDHRFSECGPREASSSEF